MTALILIAIDLVAMAALVFGLYFPRHRRADLVAVKSKNFLFKNVNYTILHIASFTTSFLMHYKNRNRKSKR